MSAPNLDLKTLDVRVVQAYIDRGIITRAQYEAYLESLPDDEASGVKTDTRMSHINLRTSVFTDD
jgi:hypothetical protein